MSVTISEPAHRSNIRLPNWHYNAFFWGIPFAPLGDLVKYFNEFAPVKNVTIVKVLHGAYLQCSARVVFTKEPTELIEKFTPNPKQLGRISFKLDDTKAAIGFFINGITDRCNECGNHGHLAETCYNRKRSDDSTYSLEELIESSKDKQAKSETSEDTNTSPNNNDTPTNTENETIDLTNSSSKSQSQSVSATENDAPNSKVVPQKFNPSIYSSLTIEPITLNDIDELEIDDDKVPLNTTTTKKQTATLNTITTTTTSTTNPVEQIDDDNVLDYLAKMMDMPPAEINEKQVHNTNTVDKEISINDTTPINTNRVLENVNPTNSDQIVNEPNTTQTVSSKTTARRIRSITTKEKEKDLNNTINTPDKGTTLTKTSSSDKTKDVVISKDRSSKKKTSENTATKSTMASPPLAPPTRSKSSKQ